MARIVPERLLADLRTLRSIGVQGIGGVQPAFSVKDMEACRRLAAQCEEAGLEATIDSVGNVLGRSRMPGRLRLVGSHSDTQPMGGRLDGAPGVYALEVARASRSRSAAAGTSLPGARLACGRYRPGVQCGGLELAVRYSYPDYPPSFGGGSSSRIALTGNKTMRVRILFGATALFAIAGLLAVPAMALPAPESEPTLATKDLVPTSVALTGAGYQVDSPTEVKDFLGRFSIQSDWGPLDATGATLLSLRIAEMPALAELERVSRVDVFSRAIAESAGKTVDGIVRVARDPVGTVAGIPAGVGRLMWRATGMVGSAASAVSASMQSGGGDAGSAGSQATDFAKEFAGLNRARRSLARSMGIDPYTGNPLVQRRLEDLAWASVAGGVPVSVATGAVSGVAGTMLTVTRRLDSLVWDLSPTEIREHLEPRLTARGNSPKIAREFLRNTTFTPTLQLLFVDALEPLGTIKGEEGLLKIAIGSRSEAHALFLIQQLRMIRRHAGNDPVRELIALEQSVVARLGSGRRVLALPVDYLSWTARVAELADHGRQDKRARELIVSGIVSPTAASAARELGWRVSDQAGLVLD